jgi:hypothetical protein
VGDFYQAYQVNKAHENSAFGEALKARVLDHWSKKFVVKDMNFDGQPKGVSLESLQALEMMADVLRSNNDSALYKLIKQATNKLLKEAASTSLDEGQDFQSFFVATRNAAKST